MDIPLNDTEYNHFQKLVGRTRAQEAEAYVLYGDFDQDSPQEKGKKLQKIYSSAYTMAKEQFIDNSTRIQEIVMSQK